MIEINDEIREIFVSETGEIITGLNNELIELEQNPKNYDAFKSIYRNMHTLKSSASVFNLTLLKVTAHRFEDLLELALDKSYQPSKSFFQLLFDGLDHIKKLFSAFTGDQSATDSDKKEHGDLIARIENFMKTVTQERCDDLPSEALALIQGVLFEFQGIEGLLVGDTRYHNLAKAIQSLQLGMDDLVIDIPENSGKWMYGEQDISAPINNCQLWLDTHQQDEISPEEISFFFQEVSRLIDCLQRGNSNQLNALATEMQETLNLFKAQGLELIDMIVDYFAGALKKVMDLVQMENLHQLETNVAKGAPDSSNNPEKGQLLSKTIKVNEEKIDNFLNSVGELITIGEVLKTLQNKMEITFTDQNDLVKELEVANLEFAEQIFALQDSLMELRRVEVLQLMTNYPRMVRDLGVETRKSVVLSWDGEKSTFDKSLYEDLDKMLIHLIRNAVDHGLETDEEREVSNKSVPSRITIQAKNDESFLYIEVADDGRGIDGEKLKQAVASKNLKSLTELSRLSPEETLNLIFLPGVTTAKKVSDISGRGVGMDAVLEILKQRNGKIKISSTAQVGTCFSLQLPLKATLGVIDGLTVRVVDTCFIIPTQYILFSFRPTIDQIVSLGQSSVGIKVRDKVFPLIQLERRFNSSDRQVFDYEQGICILIEHKERACALWVDEVLEKRQVVLKTLDNLAKSNDILGGAIMGDGSVGLVINVENLL